jgi:hypothetical protein
MDTREGEKTPAGDGDSDGKRKLKHQKERKGDRQRQQQFERDLPEHGGPQGQKDKDYQRKD